MELLKGQYATHIKWQLEVKDLFQVLANNSYNSNTPEV